MIRELLEKWLDVDEDAAYTRGLRTGVEETSRLFDDRIERKAINLFCEKGYPNPLHVFDVTIQTIRDGNNFKQIQIPYLSQEPITKPKALQLSQEAGLLKSMLLYDVIQESIRQEAVTKAMKSVKWEDVITAKSMLVNLGIIKKIVDTVQSINIEKLPDGIGTPSQKML
jgi:hypothetical protein